LHAPPIIPANLETFEPSFPRKRGLKIVIPAKAGIHLLPTRFLLSSHPEIHNMDSRFRGNDDLKTTLSRE
jgi:hypothetical protein